MTLIKKEEIKLITQHEKGYPCISIYIPTHKSGQEVNQRKDYLSFKNALQEIQHQLEGQMDPPVINELLKPAKALLEDAIFWRYQSEGLAVLIGRNLFKYYKVPEAFEYFVEIGNSYYLKPLVPLVVDKGKFFLLALSQNNVRLFEASQHSYTQLYINDLVPQSREYAIPADQSVESHLQYHTGSNRTDQAMYHSHGGQKDVKKLEMEKYLREVSNGLTPLLKGENAPMIIAADKPVAAMYRKVTSYGNVIDEVIPGNPEQKSDAALHNESWEKMKVYLNENRESARKEFSEWKKTKKASDDIEEILPAIQQGKVKNLFVLKDAHVWGNYNPESNKVSIQKKRMKDNVCLLDKAALQTLLKGGGVYLADEKQMPDTSQPIAATYRFD